MKVARRKDLAWLLTVAVLVVVLGAGARLIYLGVGHHEDLAHQNASDVAFSFATRIEPSLRALAAAAGDQSAAAPGHPSTFLLTSDGKIRAVSSSNPTIAAVIAGEWQAANSARVLSGPAILGPIRQGSEWLMAAGSPIGDQPDGSSGWSIAYASLDNLIADGHLGRLVGMGYQFELAQFEWRSGRLRVFVSTSTEPLQDAVASEIRLPAGFSSMISGSALQLAVRPTDGWFPPARLASEIALLVFLAWAFAFGVHDLSHELERTRALLATTRKRLHAVNGSLSSEMQQRLSLQETFDHARFHDAFTGLPNRRYLMDQLERALRDVRAKRSQGAAVLLVGMSRFKLVNDTLGHTAGDDLMVQVASRFQEPTASFQGVLARWTNDQFAVLLPDVVSTDGVLQLAELLQQKTHLPFELRRHRLRVAATVGITLTTSGQQRAEDVVREADLALNVAMHQERQKIAVYSSSMAGQAASIVSLEADLHIALEKHEFHLLFQPIVELQTRMMIGAEALLRWRHPVEGILVPERFLRIAEDAGLMGPIARWVILRVCKLAMEWRKRMPADQEFYISINLSPNTLRDTGLGEYVATVLREIGLPPHMLKFEITEAAIINNVAMARDTLNTLHTLGVQLMLDDFGTGYSSLSYLQLFPFDFVKIDRPFVNRLGADVANTGMTAAMVQIARGLKLIPIAEIIETSAAAAAVQAMGCAYAQGYYFSEPLEAGSIFHRLMSGLAFEPASTGAETMEIATLPEDTSATMLLPAGELFDPGDQDPR